MLLGHGLAVVHISVEGGAGGRRVQARAATGVELGDVVPVVAVPDDPAVVLRLVRAGGVAHGIALILVHEALAVHVHVQEGLAAGQEDVAAHAVLVELEAVGQNGAVPDHAGAAGLKLGAGPQRHADAVAGLGHRIAQSAPGRVARGQIGQHLVVGAVAAGTDDDALGSVHLDKALLALGHHAGHAAGLVDEELLCGRFEADLAAEIGGEHIGHDFEVRVGSVVRAVRIVLIEAGVVAHGRIVGMRVVGAVPLEGEEHALGAQRVGHPFDHLTGLLGPGLVHEHVRVAGLGLVGVVQKRRHVFLMVGGQFGIQSADGLAGGGDGAGLLQHDHLRAVLGGGGGGHKAPVARAHNHDVGVNGFHEFRGHLRLVAPACRGRSTGVGGLRAALGRGGRRAARKAHGGQGAGRGGTGQKSTTGKIGFHCILLKTVRARPSLT